MHLNERCEKAIYSGTERKVTKARLINYNLAAIAEGQTDARYSQDTSCTQLLYKDTKPVTDVKTQHTWVSSSVFLALIYMKKLYLVG